MTALARLVGGALLAATAAAGIARADAPADADWQDYAARFVAAEGRIVDTGNGGISHSEGQGCGLLLAVAFADRERFDRIWAWTRANLQVRDDRLFAWKWQPEEGGGGRVVDRNSAADGDLLIAWALLRADARWHGDEYRAAAQAILRDARVRLVARSAFGPVLLPGPDGFRRARSLVVNLSYVIFPALADFARFDRSGPWANLGRTGLALIDKARFGAWRLPPDWLELAGTEVRPADGFEPVYGFNAIRIPLYAIWATAAAGDAGRKAALLAPFRSLWSYAAAKGQIPATVDLASGRFADYGLSGGGRAVVMLASGAPAEEVAAGLPRLGPQDDYYSATLILLSRIALQERTQR